jgi:hypothetical protein
MQEVISEYKASDDGVWQSELLGFRNLFIVRCSNELENTVFQKRNLFPFSGGEALTLLRPLGRANLNLWTRFRNVLLSSFFRIPDDGQSSRTQ